MAKTKNLSAEDHDDVNIWIGQAQRVELKNNVNINDIQIKVKCLNEKQKDFKKAIEDNEVVIAIGPAGCLINSEKIKIYKLKQ